MHAKTADVPFSPMQSGLRALQAAANSGEPMYAVLEWGADHHGIVPVQSLTSTGITIPTNGLQMSPGDAVVLHFGPSASAPAWTTGGVIEGSAEDGAVTISLDAVLGEDDVPTAESPTPLFVDDPSMPSVVVVSDDKPRAAALVAWFESLGRHAVHSPVATAARRVLGLQTDSLELILVDAARRPRRIPELLRRIRTIEVLVPMLVCGEPTTAPELRRQLVYSGADEVIPTGIGRTRVWRLGCQLMARAHQVRAGGFDGPQAH